MIKVINSIYIKITGVSINEEGSDWVDKLYSMGVLYNEYADVEKTQFISTKTEVFSQLKENELWLIKAYELLCSRLPNNEFV